MRKSYEYCIKQLDISHDYTDIYGIDTNHLHIVDETRLAIDEISSHKFLYHLSPLHGKGYIKQGYFEMPKSLFYDIFRLIKSLKNVMLEDEMQDTYRRLKIQTEELYQIYLNKKDFCSTPYEVIGVHHMDDIRSSRIFLKHDFQVPKEFIADSLRFTVMVKRIKCNKVVRCVSANTLQALLLLIEDREKIFRKIRNNLIRYIEDTTPTRTHPRFYKAVSYDTMIQERCITILISTVQCI